jgi:hypothetical protein
LTKKYLDIVDKEAEGEDATKLWVQCEKIEKQLEDMGDPVDILYSDKTETVISYRQKVAELEKDKDDFLISLAGWKGETVMSLGTKTVADLFSLAERYNEEMNGRYSD